MSARQTVTIYVDVAPTDDLNWDAIISTYQVSQGQGYVTPELLSGWKRYRVQFQVPKHQTLLDEIVKVSVQEEEDIT